MLRSLLRDCQNICSQFLGDLAHFNPGMVRLVAALFGLVIVSHWLACFWYMVAYDELRKVPSIDSLPLDSDHRLPFPMDEIQVGPP